MNNLINKQILEKLAVLAKIEIKKENKEKLLADLGEILNHFQELQNVNIGDIEPLNGGTNLINISRNDENKDVNKEDVGLVGGKGANLGEMTRAGFPVPNGFIVTAPAYFQFLRENKLEEEINEILKEVNYKDPASLEKPPN